MAMGAVACRLVAFLFVITLSRLVLGLIWGLLMIFVS
jgi:hypothetical protein